MKACTKCKGTGRSSWDGRKCPFCHGECMFPEPDYRQILEDICTARGQKKTFRRSKPLLPENTIRGARAYFVWRLARFHGGADVTMPMIAEMVAEGDPYREELDSFAGKIAEIVFGTQLAATARWSPLLGLGSIPTRGLPSSAREGGPVLLDGDKPIEELMEML